jgi:hypothetical protein
MKRLVQGHLHPKLEVPGPTCPGRESNTGLHGGSRALKKEPFEQLVNSYSEHPHMSARPVARDSAITSVLSSDLGPPTPFPMVTVNGLLSFYSLWYV